MPTDPPRVPGKDVVEQLLPRALLGRVTDAYNMLWKMVIRPPRDNYALEELGPEKFRMGKRVYLRRDIQLKSSRGTLECSHFMPAKFPEDKRACVVYLHGNCSSRLEVFDALPVLLQRDITVFCLDLSGSGRSEGEFISLGYHEEKDLRCVLRYLRSLESVSSVGLWGRSMGATTSILCAAQDSDLAACILDSAFRDLRTVATELVSRGSVPIPPCLVNWALETVRSEVSSRADFDPLELMPIRSAPDATCPAMFGVAADDTFVLPHHTQELHDAWGGDKELRVFDGGHNGVRPDWFLEEAAEFLGKRLAKGLKEPNGKNTVQGVPVVSRPRAPLAVPVVCPSSCSTESTDAAAETAAPAPCPREVEADVAAGRPTLHAMLDGSIPRQKCEMAVQLTKMGFRLDDIMTAVKDFSSREDAVEWLQDQQPTPGSPAKLAKPVEAGLAEPPPPSAAPPTLLCDSALSPKPRHRRAGPLGRSIADQLQYLGFGEDDCEKASRRCLSLEDAVNYLSSEQVTLHL